MRVRIQLLTSGIRAVLSCSLNISSSSPSHASLGPQLAARTPIVPAHPSSPAQTSSSSSEAASSPRSSPSLARHIRRTVSALGRLERAAPTVGRGCRGRRTRASGGRDCNDGGKGDKAGDGGTASSKGRSRSSSGGGCNACGGSRARGSAQQQHQQLCLSPRKAAREQAAQWAAAHPLGHGGGSPDGHGCAGDALGTPAAVPPTAVAAQTGADALATRLTEIAAFTGGATLPPRTGTMVIVGSRPLSGTSVPVLGGLPSPRPTTSSGPR
jgi:hypothetical protein